MTVRLRRLLASAALAMFTLALCFALGELAVRLLYGKEARLFPRYHTDFTYGRYKLRGIRPNSEFWHTSVDGSWRFVTNSRGFRNDRDFAYAKSPGVVRILNLGDSHTQGYEVRQQATFAAALERYLAARGVQAESINAGVSGFSTAEELAFLENEGFKYNPNVVVLGFYVNDFEDNLKAGLFGLDGSGQLVERRFEHTPGVAMQNLIYSLPVTKWLSENSYFYSLLFNNVWNYFKERLADRARDEAPQPHRDRETAQAGIEYAVANGEKLSLYEIELAAALLTRMHLFCKSRQFRFMVVDIPRKPARYRFASSFPPQLLAKLRQAGIEYIASESILSAYDAAAEFHLPHGHYHISEFTHAVIAAEIGRRLVGAGAHGGAAK
jgi:hypothetical protein